MVGADEPVEDELSPSGMAAYTGGWRGFPLPGKKARSTYLARMYLQGCVEYGFKTGKSNIQINIKR
jgi:hypothetical protein